MGTGRIQPREVLIAGGGPAAIETALALAEQAGELVAISLLTPERDFVDRPQAVLEPFGGPPAKRYSLSALAADRGFVLRSGALAAVDAHARVATTAAGEPLSYDALVLALGARPMATVPGSVTFGGPHDSARVRAALETVTRRRRPRVAFVAAETLAWTLPLYELALLTRAWADRRGTPLEVCVVTAEARPLGAFGATVSASVAELLARAGVLLMTSAHAVAAVGGRLLLGPDEELPLELAVSLPAVAGRRIAGLPHDQQGFVPVDDFGRITGVRDVFAVGDMTTHPVKQGGLATQQADAAASALAAWAGAAVEPVAYHPQLRAMLLTDTAPRFLTRVSHAVPPVEDVTGLAPWQPSHKVVSRHLAPYLDAHPELERRAVAPGRGRIGTDPSAGA